MNTSTFLGKSSRELRKEDSFAMGAGIFPKPITNTHEKSVRVRVLPRGGTPVEPVPPPPPQGRSVGSDPAAGPGVCSVSF